MSSSDEVEFDGGVQDQQHEEEQQEPTTNGKKEDTPSPRRASKRQSSLAATAKIRQTPNDDDAEEEDFDDDGDDDDYDDDDDDVPLAALVTKKKSPAKTKTNGNKKKTSSTSSPVKKKLKTKSSASTTSSTSDKKYEYASAALYGTESLKGLLIQRLLCRWWYAMEWPSKDLVQQLPPKGYDALDGFPGVFVGTTAETVGKIQDLRDRETSPCFANFVRKDAAELKTLLLKALEEQKKQLLEHEGTNTPTEKELDSLIKWANKVKPEKADKEAEKVLKASGIRLP